MVYSENLPICWLYLFWLTANELQILKMRFYLLQFILNNLNVDWSGLYWTVIVSASAFIILLSSNFLVLMTTWYFCKVPICLGEFLLGCVIMGQQFLVSPPCADWMVILPTWWFFTMLTTDHETWDLLILLLQVSVVTCHWGLSTEPDGFFLRFSYLQWQVRIFSIFFSHTSQTTNCLVISSCLLLFSYPFFFFLVLHTLDNSRICFLAW